MSLWCRVVDIARRDHGEPLTGGQLGQHIIVGVVKRVAVMVEFHCHVVSAKPVHKLTQLVRGRTHPGGLRPIDNKRLPHPPFAASAEEEPVPIRPFGQVVEVIEWATLLCPRQLGGSDCTGEPMVAFLSAGENEQVAAARVGDTILRSVEPQGEFGPERRLQLRELFCSLRHAHDPVETVVIGDREPV